MKFIDYIEQASKLELKKENKNLSIAILRSYTCENLEPIIKTELYKENFNVNIEFGTFNQYYQEAIDGASFLYEKSFDIVLLLIRPADLFAGIYDLSLKENLKVNQAIDKIKNMIDNIKQNSSVKAIIMANMEEYENELEGILEYNSSNSVITFLKKFNMQLINLKEQYSNFYIIDINKIITTIGARNTYNNKMKYLSKDPYKVDFYIEMVRFLRRVISNIFYTSKKVLLLDLDNTLYQGILGEDDIDKITNFSEYPEAHYNNLQIKIKNLKNRGVLLGLVTKNNYKDVENLFNLQKMPLQLDDFVVIKANWEDKYLNIKQISEELNLDLNSFVFIDDNPYEIELVNKKLSQVETINISSKPEEAEKVLDEIYFFDKLSITKEDMNRTRNV